MAAGTASRCLADRPDVDVTEDYWGGLRLMERMIGYDRAIVIDAICTGAPPGTIHHLTDDVDADAEERLGPRREPADRLGLRPPGRRAPARGRACPLVGIEAEDLMNFSEQCTPAVAAAIPRRSRK